MDLTHLSSQLKLKTDFNAGEALGLRDINSITGVVDNSVTSLQALIFSNQNPEMDDRNPSRFDVTGMTSGYDGKAFVFDIKREYKYNLSSNITDHYVEDNVAIQDHIGLKPIILEVNGSIGEVTLKDKIGETSDLDKYLGEQTNKNIFNSIDSYLDRMGSLSSFTPNIINQSLDIYNTAKFGYSTVSKIINLDKKDSSSSRRFAYNSVYDEEVIKTTNQFEWVDWFTTQWKNRASFTIVTPYGVLTDMYIMDLSASQPENTRYVTNLNIKFKQIRRAKIITRNRKVSKTMDKQITKQQETGILVRKFEDGTTIIDATQDKTESVVNSQYDFGGSQLLNEGTYNVPSETKQYTTSSIENTYRSFGMDTNDAVIKGTKVILGQG